MGFVEFIDTCNYSENTIKAYLFYYNKLMEHLGEREVPTQKDIDDMCVEYNNNVFRAFLRLFVIEYLKNREIDIPKHRGKTKYRIPKHLEPVEIEMLYKEASKELRIVILLGFYSGLRISEILSITPENIKSGKIIGKGNKEGRIYINDFTRKVLNNYIVANDIKKDERLLKFSRINIDMKLYRLSEKVLGKKVSPHALRHSCGRYLRSKGVDLGIIKRVLRHTNISTTSIYAESIDEEVKEKWKEVMG